MTTTSASGANFRSVPRQHGLCTILSVLSLWGRTVRLRDVTLRDGLQDERPIEIEEKLALFDLLLGAGIDDLELCSFVRPDLVPAMADAEELARLTAGTPATRWALVLNSQGAERALGAGMTHLQWVVSASEAHQIRNARASVRESLAEMRQVVALATEHDPSTRVETTVATALGCPYTGPVKAAVVATLAEEAIEAGAVGVSIADTIGSGVPTEVSDLVTTVRQRVGDRPIGVHLHDTRGLGLANALAAIEAGVDRVDGTVGGLGGCPFAPGASGNLPLEDLVHASQHMGIETGIDLDALLEAAACATAAVGRPVSSHVGVAGPRFARLSPA